MAEGEPRVHEFGPFRLDPVERILLRDGQPVPLTDKVFELLLLLVRNRGRALTKAQLMDSLWPDTVVEENNLTVNMSLLRKALGEGASERRYVETLPRRGYRFIGVPPHPSAPEDAAAAVGRSPSPPYAERSGPGLVATPSPARAFVGRERELERLEQLFRMSAGGRGRVVFITGASGMGKTCLCEELVSRAQAREPLLFATGRSVERHGPSEAYAPFLDMIGALLEGANGELVRRNLEQRAPSWCAQFAVTARDGHSGDAVPNDAGGATAARMLRELGDALQTLSATTPLLLFLEDLHWADPSSVDLLRLLAERIGNWRALLVVTFRAEQVEVDSHPLKNLARELLVHDRCEEVVLSLLDRASIAGYLDATFRSHDFPTDFIDWLARRTEGQPLFLTRLVQLLVDAGDVRRAEATGRFGLARPVSALELGVPANVRGLIERKFESLEERDRLALRYASVVGVEFSSALLAALTREDEMALDERLDEIARRHRLIELVGEEALAGGRSTIRYRFAHALYQSVLYEALAGVRRMSLHAQVAEYQLQQSGGNFKRVAAQIAQHFEHARAFERAIEFWIEAADNSSRLHADAQAAAQYEHALKLASDLEPAERIPLTIILLYNHAWCRSKIGHHDIGRRDFEAMLRCANAPEFADPGEQGMRARIRVWDYFEQPWRDASGVFEMPRMPNQPRTLGPSALQCEAYWGLAYTLFESDRLGELRSSLDEFLRVADASNNPPRRAEALGWMAGLEFKLGNLGEVVRLGDESIRASRSLGHVRPLIMTLRFRAAAHSSFAEYEDAEALLVECLELSFEAQSHGACLLELGKVRSQLGDTPGATAALNEARRIAERKEQADWVRAADHACGELYFELGGFERAIEYFTRCAESARGRSLPLHEARALLQLGKALSLASNVAAARAVFERLHGLGWETPSADLAVLHRNPRARTAFALSNEWARAEYRLALGDLETSERHAANLLEIAQPALAVRHVVIARHLLARLALARGDHAAVRQQVQAGIETLGDRRVPLLRARLSTTLAAAT